MRTNSSIEVLIQRDRLWISLGLVAVITFAWVYLLREAPVTQAIAAADRVHAAVAGMDTRAWDLTAGSRCS